MQRSEEVQAQDEDDDEGGYTVGDTNARFPESANERRPVLWLEHELVCGLHETVEIDNRTNAVIEVDEPLLIHNVGQIRRRGLDELGDLAHDNWREPEEEARNEQGEDAEDDENREWARDVLSAQPLHDWVKAERNEECRNDVDENRRELGDRLTEHDCREYTEGDHESEFEGTAQQCFFEVWRSCIIRVFLRGVHHLLGFNVERVEVLGLRRLCFTRCGCNGRC